MYSVSVKVDDDGSTPRCAMLEQDKLWVLSKVLDKEPGFNTISTFPGPP
jgi:hypothetical protein